MTIGLIETCRLPDGTVDYLIKESTLVTMAIRIVKLIW
jgi:hypothetical protein